MGFAEHLIERNVVSPEQVERALAAKRLYGGRLGSNLVETGALEAAELTARLSEFLGVPPPPASWLAERSAEAERAVPASLVRRHKAVPLRVEKRTLHVAVLDPRDTGLRQALGQTTDLQIEIWVLPELRLYSLLGKRYGIRRERSVSLAQLAVQARKRREARAPSGVREPDAGDEQRRALGIAPLEEGEELVGETFFSDLHAGQLPGNADGTNADTTTGRSLPPLDDSLFEPIESGEPSPATSYAANDATEHELSARDDGAAASGLVTPAHPSALEQAIASAPDRESLIDGVLELACAHARSSALLVLDDGMLAGRRALVEGEPRSLEGVRLSCRGEGGLGRAAASGEPWRGAPAGPADEQLLAELRRPAVHELAVLPILLDDLTLALLCADGGPHPIPRTSFAALCELARMASESWARLTLGGR